MPMKPPDPWFSFARCHRAFDTLDGRRLSEADRPAQAWHSGPGAR